MRSNPRRAAHSHGLRGGSIGKQDGDCLGETFWSEEQSRKNFEMASKLVNPGDPDTSRLLMQPLAPEGGGNVFHSGGRQFASKDDPNWKVLADWVNGKKL